MDNTIFLNSNIGHHCKIKKNSLISGAKLGGKVNIGSNCFIGMGAVVKEGVCVGNNNIIGMNCTINRNTNDYEVYTAKHATLLSPVPSTRIKNFL